MKCKSAFTLIELAIVLVIIGLLVGGILVGRSLVRQAEMSKAVTDYQKFQAATNSFRLKYDSLPGDYPYAMQNLGSVGNGNGNDIITTWTENFLFWEHLAKGGFIPGNYTGVTGGGSAFNSIAGTNIPAGATERSGYMVIAKYFSGGTPSYYFFPPDGQLGFLFGRDVTNSYHYGTLFLPSEGLQLDKKFDDGAPGTGIMQVINTSLAANCATTSLPETAEYNIGYTRPGCAFWFRY